MLTDKVIPINLCFVCKNSVDKLRRETVWELIKRHRYLCLPGLYLLKWFCKY